ncbi:MAG: flagellar hook-associated protein FlgL [Defluviitoga tunisiensis]|jgi:flagellar hook-associated protein 3 FlgL|uniref:Flagellar hook-associated protein 3 n=1 Tax=Defluviitoga tunisiensis TaxID=1006576 RepID=A0A0C7NYS0_DEFTU|nr:flagellar hook-associated protein FlgL [Defluviitoga tunisiensis]CEP78403.1 flagellar hook-associated protein 3 [Defluviitoga tunisiensis]HOB55688.1 flagellar hook-associated protein FlgL [Defluviitoga tunisiensis]HOK16876.1 flagellar hook-associated protein FlgL [Defluviitoga tunisiensis]HOL86579.1 flagellar hook-associated protein FlgL [Defluviitoga tunisiensis]HPP10111.1 flagellar hook-associated protein FlgL [Defluviitoga tunisiensis]
MRITENLLSKQTLQDINDILRRYTELNSQLTSEKKYRYPSDNAAVVSKVSNLDSRLREIERYTSNIQTAKNYVNMYDTSIQEISSIFYRIKELAVSGAHGTLSVEDRNAITEELDKINTHLVSIANTEIGGNYIFGGAQNNKKVVTDDFEITVPPSANVRNKISLADQEIEYGVTVYDVFVTDSGASVFGIINRLSKAIGSGDNDSIQKELGNIDEIQTKSLNSLAKVGSVERMFEMTLKRMGDFDSFTTEFLSKESDADLAEVIMQLSMQQTILQAALKAASSIIPPTLVDFI